jgi:hypothetical protein
MVAFWFPRDRSDLPIGQSVEIQVGVAVHEVAAGVPSAVLAAALSEPHASSEDVRELERAIANSKLPLAKAVDFDHDAP